MRATLLNPRVLLGAFVIILALVAAWFWWGEEPEEVPAPEEPIAVQEVVPAVIGRSVEDRVIEAYTFGEGEKHLVFVGGIHGGYEWNSTLLAYDMMDLFKEEPEMIPTGVKVTIIPVLNPDGLYDVIGQEGKFGWDVAAAAGETGGVGRMNSRGVDLNRNFDCNWQATSTWRGTEVSAGTAAFSEPEAAALRDFVAAQKPTAVVFWHSQANAVYASECNEGVLPATLDLMNTYASAAGYEAVETFDAYKVTGDAEGWLASIGIPAITVEMSSHTTTDWQKNLAGVRAVLNSI